MKSFLYLLQVDSENLFHWYLLSSAGVCVCCCEEGFVTETEALDDLMAHFGPQIGQ
jgi:hypothetical protein